MPEAATIAIQGPLSWTTLPSYLRQLEPLTARTPKEVTLDLSAMNYCWPIGVATLAGLIFWLRDYGVKKISACRPTDKKVEQYLERVNFYRVLNAPEILRFNRNDASGRFVELTQLTSVKDCQGIAKKVEEVFAQQMTLADETKNALDFVVDELAENVFHHAKSAVGGFLCCQAYPYSLEVAIVDLGRGIEKALADNPAISATVEQKGALRAALEPKVTGRPKRNTGMGLFWTSKLIEGNGGELGIQSYRRRLSQNAATVQEGAEAFWPGTAIHLSFHRGKPMDIVRIYNRYAPPEKGFDFIG